MNRHRIALVAALGILAASLVAPSLAALAGIQPPALERLSVPSVRLNVPDGHLDTVTELVARVEVQVGEHGNVETARLVGLDGALPEESSRRLEDAALAAARAARFAPGRGGTALLEIAWQVGGKRWIGSGDATIEPTAEGARAIVAPPKRLVAGIEPPVMVHRVEPAYPPDARARGLEGMTLLEAVIGADGTVTDARILKGGEPALDQAALDAVRQWTYTPATQDGVPVATMLVVRLAYRLK